MKGKKESVKKKKVEYHRLTFMLSVIGFIGSIGFYLGVLRQVYSPAQNEQKIEQLQVENQQLKQSIYVLVEKLEEEDERESEK